MALKPKIAKLEDVAENLRAFYKADGDAFVIDIEGGYDDGAELRSALEGERAENKDLKKKLKGFDGFDVKEVASLKKEIATLKAAQPDAAQWQAEKEQMIATHTAELKTRDDKLIAVTESLHHTVVDVNLLQAITEKGGNAELLLPVLKARVKPIEEDGKIVARVVNEKGNVLTHGPKGEPMPLDVFVDQMKADPRYQQAFKASGSTGGGGGGNEPPTPTDITSKPLKDWTAKEKGDFIREHGTDKYRDIVDKQSSIKAA